MDNYQIIGHDQFVQLVCLKCAEFWNFRNPAKLTMIMDIVVTHGQLHERQAAREFHDQH